MSLDDYLSASEEQTELLEELRSILKELEEAPGDIRISQRILEILKRLKELRRTLAGLSEEESEGDIGLLKEFYELVGAHDEYDLLKELEQMVREGRVELPLDVVREALEESREFKRKFLKNSSESGQ